ncbi:MAG: radical SAM protein [Cytophagales bacterium]|nr:radical SAM protein [Cytophagales bacterium]
MIREIIAKSILRRHKRIDSWFLSSYAINLYRGCTHNCVYCDGRDEKYQVEGEFGRDIAIKTNALELLDKELDPKRKRKPFDNGFFMVCGGVSDSYQPFEKKYRLSRNTLELLFKYGHPVHMLTKSTLIERDLELLQRINMQNKAIVSFSFSSVDDKISKLVEPGVSSPSQRLATIKKFKEAGIMCGIYLMPVIPFVTDTYEMIDQTVAKAKGAGADFVIFSGMTLKKGRQKAHYMKFLNQYFPELIPRYVQIYPDGNPWGAPKSDYAFSIEKIFDNVATNHGMPKRIPSTVFRPFVSRSELVTLILEQLDYLVKLKGKKSPYGHAAYSLSNIDKPIETLSTGELHDMRGIGPVTAKFIREIIETGRCRFYENML